MCFLILTFFSILKPFNKVFHLFKEDALALGGMGVLIPLQDSVLRQDVS